MSLVFILGKFEMLPFEEYHGLSNQLKLRCLTNVSLYIFDRQ
jgi:hypothetical protein